LPATAGACVIFPEPPASRLGKSTIASRPTAAARASKRTSNLRVQQTQRRFRSPLIPMMCSALVEKYPDWVWAASVGALTVVLTVLRCPPYQAPELAYALLYGDLLAYRRPVSLVRRHLFAAQAVAWTACSGGCTRSPGWASS